MLYAKFPSLPPYLCLTRYRYRYPYPYRNLPLPQRCRPGTHTTRSLDDALSVGGELGHGVGDLGGEDVAEAGRGAKKEKKRKSAWKRPFGRGRGD